VLQNALASSSQPRRTVQGSASLGMGVGMEGEAVGEGGDGRKEVEGVVLVSFLHGEGYWVGSEAGGSIGRGMGRGRGVSSLSCHLILSFNAVSCFWMNILPVLRSEGDRMMRPLFHLAPVQPLCYSHCCFSTLLLRDFLHLKR
jgi:hypothetical protein